MSKTSADIEVLSWVEGVLNRPEVRAKLEHVVTADTFQAQQLAQRLMQLRTSLRENAYNRIFEARAKVSEDLLALQQSLSQLIHFSAVAGEDANMFISLQRSVVSVTQKLSVFGEDDADGDGMRDDQAQAPGQAQPANPATPQAPDKNAPSLSLDVDTAPIAPDNQPQPPASAEPKPEQVQQDPDDIADENANPEPAGNQNQETEEPGQAQQAEPGSDLEKPPTAPEGEEGAQEPADGQDDPKDPKDIKLSLNDVGEQPQDEEDPDDGVDGEEPETDEDQEGLKKEFSDVAKKVQEKNKKQGLFESLVTPGIDGKAQATAKTDKVKPSFRFAYRGVRGETVSMLVTDRVYYIKPAANYLGGNVDRLNKAITKHMDENPGYNATLQQIRLLISQSKLVVVKRVRLTKQQLRKTLRAPEQKTGQFGAVVMDPTTAWKFRGVGVQKTTNQATCIYFEVGDTEYGAVPDKTFKDKDIDDVAGSIFGHLKKVSYTDGFKYLEKLVRNGSLRIIYQDKIGE